MAVEINLEGNGAWAGGGAELSTYAVDEESTPLTAGDTSGAIGSIRFSAVTVEDSPLLYETPFTLNDESNGTVSGTIRGLNLGHHIAEISGESILGPLVPERQMVPRQGSLQAVISGVLQDSGVTAEVLFDDSLAATTTVVAVQGWYGSAWEWLKLLCQTYQFEITVVGDKVLVRAPRTRTSNVETDTERRVNIERGEVAKHIEIVRYENTYKANAMVYPAGGWSEDLETYSVEANETIEVEVPVDVSIMSIDQPNCVSFIPRVYDGPSVYTVSGNDGLPIPPQMWKDFGGKVEVAIGEDTKTIIIKMTGMNVPEYSPFTLSVNSGPSDTYSTLRLRGTGVHFTKETLKFPTGADPRWASADVGITIDNPTIQNMNQVATLAFTATREYSAPTVALSATALVVNRPGEAGFVRYLTFGDFDAARPDTYTFQSYKTEFAGKTFGQVRETLRDASGGTDRYENQAFGNVVGSVVRHGDSMFRIRRATITESGVNYEAEADTTFSQMKSEMAGMTFAQIKAVREGMLFSEVALMPLRKS